MVIHTPLTMGYVCTQATAIVFKLSRSIDRTIINFINVSSLPTDYKWPANWGHPILIIYVKLQPRSQGLSSCCTLERARRGGGKMRDPGNEVVKTLNNNKT